VFLGCLKEEKEERMESLNGEGELVVERGRKCAGDGHVASTCRESLQLDKVPHCTAAALTPDTVERDRRDRKSQCDSQEK
jgi:hypothetical protein